MYVHSILWKLLQTTAGQAVALLMRKFPLWLQQKFVGVLLVARTKYYMLQATWQTWGLRVKRPPGMPLNNKTSSPRL